MSWLGVGPTSGFILQNLAECTGKSACATWSCIERRQIILIDEEAEFFTTEFAEGAESKMIEMLSSENIFE
jgi:hypothetical protein